MGRRRGVPSDSFVIVALSGNVYAARFAPDGRTLLTGSSDRTLRLWDVGKRAGSYGVSETLEGDTNPYLDKRDLVSHG
jgi:WD40 repeat protein